MQTIWDLVDGSNSVCVPSSRGSFVRCVMCVFGCVVLAGCGGGVPQGLQRGKVGCEEAVGQGVSAGKANARLVAQTTASYQAEDLKGFMLRDGFRAVVLRGRRIDCQGFELGGGLTRCTAKVQVCGR